MTRDPELRKLAEELAKELHWRYMPNDDSTVGETLTDGDAKLFVRNTYHKATHVTIMGIYPHGTTYYFGPNERDNGINVAKAKGAKRIAADVTRRILPDYRATLAKVLAADELADENYARQKLAAQRIVALFPAGEADILDHGRENGIELRIAGALTDRGYGDVRLSHDAQSVLELKLRSVPMPMAMALLQAWGAMRKANI